MYTTNLMAVQEDGQKLVMMDGTVWIINPDDIKKAVKWTPPCSVQINEIDIALDYDYAIINLDEDITITAQKRR